jgi:undecaprenyl diphosphate synthase
LEFDMSQSTKTLPKHIAIIMDGNGRWARERGLPRIFGHRSGIESVREIVRTCGEIEIEILTLYVFSVENWERPREEVRGLMGMLRELLRREVHELDKNNVRLMSIGRKELLPKILREELERAIKALQKNSGLLLNLALSYGGRAEIVEAAQRIAHEVKEGRLNPNRIDEKAFVNHLYAPKLPDPDLLIRTAGEMRISNFLLWQIAYTELYVTDVLWPDFRRKNLLKAIEDYQTRNRRFGKIP